METNSVRKSIVINTNISSAWKQLSDITELDWVEGQKSTKSLTKMHRGVGTGRLISFDDGSNVEEYVVGWSPKKYFSYIATSGLPVNAYHATISLNKINDHVKITWESYFSNNGTKMEIEEFSTFLSQFYSNSLNNLKRILEK
tara:strand:- start:296 stop:724 length:429 start_codon:yes stop_codon:yes gene_type:complete